MKKLILLSAAVLSITLAVFAQGGINIRKWYIRDYSEGQGSPQDLRFEVRATYLRPVRKENLNEARFISDISPGYPVNWIEEYVSIEVVATCNGKTTKAMGTNNMLSAEQKNILKLADLGTYIVVNVNYKYKNSATGKIDTNKLHFSVDVIPEIEAEYIGGYAQMTKYLKENVINIVSEKTPKEFKHGIVHFTVNEEGEITNAKIFETSGDAKTDKLLVDAISKMPKWRPAKTAKGIKVKQQFMFSVGGGGC